MPRPPGLTTWQTRQELERTRRRQLVVVLLLAMLSVLWCALWLEVETNGEGMVAGWVVLEVITVVPLVFGARRVNKFSALIARADAYTEEDQTAEANALRDIDESIWRVGQLVSSLEDGPAREQAREALAAADRAATVLRPLVRRRTQLEHLVDGAGSQPARATLRSTLDACVTDIERLRSTIAGVTASVASLVDAASEATFHRELEHLRETTEEITALIAAFDDIAKLEENRGMSSGSR